MSFQGLLLVKQTKCCALSNKLPQGNNVLDKNEVTFGGGAGVLTVLLDMEDMSDMEERAPGEERPPRREGGGEPLLRST